MSPSAHIYDVEGKRFERPALFFHFFVSRGGVTPKATPEETRKANPHCVHIIGWLEPLLERNDIHPLNYPNLFAPEAVEKLFGGIDGLPTTYIVDGEGKIVFGCKGEFPKGDLEKRLLALLEKKK